jgi:hypothetical protein
VYNIPNRILTVLDLNVGSWTWGDLHSASYQENPGTRKLIFISSQATGKQAKNKNKAKHTKHVANTNKATHTKQVTNTKKATHTKQVTNTNKATHTKQVTNTIQATHKKSTNTKEFYYLFQETYSPVSFRLRLPMGDILKAIEWNEMTLVSKKPEF